MIVIVIVPDIRTVSTPAYASSACSIMVIADSGVGDGVGDGVGLGVAVAVAVGSGVGVSVSVGSGTGVAVGSGSAQLATTTIRKSNKKVPRARFMTSSTAHPAPTSISANPMTAIFQR
jgi:hypothetical protein